MKPPNLRAGPKHDRPRQESVSFFQNASDVHSENSRMRNVEGDYNVTNNLQSLHRGTSGAYLCALVIIVLALIYLLTLGPTIRGAFEFKVGFDNLKYVAPSADFLVPFSCLQDRKEL
ncbi:hypothetical protein K435DRAFT_797208 [Dendrothele bispora CBS 962.96]|uniref:Uncharacterized protein n=1 Tax=Dendrothele bispora (strain CBS 962.96) TaxID=1314807 RepID=A0A4S8M388_DENBC|nr:hypothetical protein K435DRAFT_797208 [Dendrothele bispora CBS 962.96]